MCWSVLILWRQTNQLLNWRESWLCQISVFKLSDRFSFYSYYSLFLTMTHWRKQSISYLSQHTVMSPIGLWTDKFQVGFAPSWFCWQPMANLWKTLEEFLKILVQLRSQFSGFYPQVMSENCLFLPVLPSVFMKCVTSFPFLVASPQVQVYTRAQEKIGEANILICHVTRFYPPLITIDLLKNGEAILKANQTELGFENNWNYHLTKAAHITLNKGDKYSCRVAHLGKSQDHNLGMSLSMSVFFNINNMAIIKGIVYQKIKNSVSRWRGGGSVWVHKTVLVSQGWTHCCRIQYNWSQLWPHLQT